MPGRGAGFHLICKSWFASRVDRYFLEKLNRWNSNFFGLRLHSKMLPQIFTQKCTNVHFLDQLWMHTALSILYIFQNWVMDKRASISEFTTRQVKIGCSKFTCYIYQYKMFVEKREIMKVLEENFSNLAIPLMDTN